MSQTLPSSEDKDVEPVDSPQNDSAQQVDNKVPEPVVPPENDFAHQADEEQPSLLAEFLDFLVHNKAWWLTPIIIVLLLVGLLVVVGSSVVAPFIYTIF